MKNILYFVLLIQFIDCSPHKTGQKVVQNETVEIDFVIAFGSCNNQRLQNPFWKEIPKNNPSVWIWGGDNIYADTDNMNILHEDYNVLKNHPDYVVFNDSIEVIGIWDDHDYGFNDGGKEYVKKDSAQSLFLDFLDVPANDERRSRQGIYDSKTYKVKDYQVKIFLLDTRYFRSGLTKDTSGKKRYLPQDTGTILGDQQWTWLSDQLNKSNADFNIIVSSIQVLSSEHGYETWGNMPHEVDKLKSMIVNSKAKGVILLSGDRHISELSAIDISGLNYPLYDFTSSGLTHSYSEFPGEPNKYRVSEVISEKSFGLLKFNFKKHELNMEVRGEGNKLIYSKQQKY